MGVATLKGGNESSERLKDLHQGQSWDSNRGLSDPTPMLFPPHCLPICVALCLLQGAFHLCDLTAVSHLFQPWEVDIVSKVK